MQINQSTLNINIIL